MKRRDFLNATVNLLGASTGLACAGQMTSAATSPAGNASAGDSWSHIRAQFELDPDKVHMAGLFLTSHPKPVREAIEGHRRGLDQDPLGHFHKYGFSYGDTIRKAVVAYAGGDPSEVALTDSTTMGLGILYSGLRLRQGDDILTTTHDHFVTHAALSFAAERTGAMMRKISLYDSPALAQETEMVHRLVSHISPNTRVVAVTWVHSGTGVKLPLALMAQAISELNRNREPDHRVLFCVDGVHGFGVEDVRIAELGCDFFSAGCHKWIFGPRGTGILWARRDAWPYARPSIPPFELNAIPVFMGKNVEQPLAFSDLMTPGGFHSFEHRWALPSAFQFHLGIGKPKIQERIYSLAQQLKQGLGRLSHIKLHTPPSQAVSSALVCFEVNGFTPKAVVEKLAERRIVASTTPYLTSYARLSPGIFNTPEEVEASVRALAGMKG